MAFKRKMYSTYRSSRLRGSSLSGNEIDLRKEFDLIIFGGAGNIPHGRKVLIRKARLDDKYQPIACVCKDTLTREADDDCPYCLGEGFYWDENLIDTYSMYLGSDGGLSQSIKNMFPGEILVNSKIFFFRYDTVLSYKDKIVEIELDEDGKIVVPYFREAIYRPETINKLRSDHGRTEYIAVYCRENDAIKIKR